MVATGALGYLVTEQFSNIIPPQPDAFLCLIAVSRPMVCRIVPKTCTAILCLRKVDSES
jgi:hypothetical protein